MTGRFVELYIPQNSRTCDQMVQAARSGKQNIAEGSVDAATSAKLEINLYNVARGSLEELKIDYQDYLHQHGFEIWNKDDLLAQKFINMHVASKKEFRMFVETAEQTLQNTVRSRSFPFFVDIKNAEMLPFPQIQLYRSIFLPQIKFWQKTLLSQYLIIQAASDACASYLHKQMLHNAVASPVKAGR